MNDIYFLEYEQDDARLENDYIVELLTPKKIENGQFDNGLMHRFAQRYQRMIDSRFGLSIRMYSRGNLILQSYL